MQSTGQGNALHGNASCRFGHAARVASHLSSPQGKRKQPCSSFSSDLWYAHPGRAGTHVGFGCGHSTGWFGSLCASTMIVRDLGLAFTPWLFVQV